MASASITDPGDSLPRVDGARTWVKALAEPALLVDPASRKVVAVNQAFCDRMKRSPPAMEGSDWVGLLGGEADAERLAGLLRRAVESGRVIDCDERHAGRITSHRLVPLLDAIGATPLCAHMMRDAAPTVEANPDLATREALYAAAQRVANVGHYTIDIPKGAITWSDELYRIYGLDPARFVPSPEGSLELVHPEDRATVQEAIYRALSASYPPEQDGRATLFHFQHRGVRPDGDIRWLLLEARADLDASGRPVFVVGTVQDRTEAFQSFERLRLSEERLRLVIAATNDGIWDWIPDTHESFYSARWKEIVGYPDDELPNTDATFFERIHPDDRPQAAETLRRHLEDQLPYRIELRLRHKDGSYRWVLARGAALRDETGRPVRMVASFTDITTRRDAEEQLRASEAELRRVVSSVTDYLWSAEGDASGRLRYRYHSPGCREITGHGPDYFAEGPDRWIALIHPDDRPRLLQAFTRLTSGASVLEEAEYRLVRDDGKEVWVRDRASAIQRPDGGIEYHGVVSDITQQKRADETRARLALVFDAATDLTVLFAVAPDGRLFVEAANSAYRQLLASAVPAGPTLLEGAERTELLRAMGLTPLAAEEAALLAAVTTGAPQRYDVILPSAVGPISLEVSLWPLQDAHARTTSLLWSARDITARVRAEAALRVSLGEKELLLREIHHRVKNNLHVVSSLLELQGDALADLTMRRSLAEAGERVRTIASLHEHLYRARDVGAVRLSSYVCELAGWMAQLYGNRHLVEVACDEALTMSPDAAVPLGLALHELLSNALRHGSPSADAPVQVTARVTDGRVRLQIRDRGPGVHADWQARIGDSLGLRVVTVLSRQLKGRFELSNDGGAVATLDFPLPPLAPLPNDSAEDRGEPA